MVQTRAQGRSQEAGERSKQSSSDASQPLHLREYPPKKRKSEKKHEREGAKTSGNKRPRPGRKAQNSSDSGVTPEGPTDGLTSRLKRVLVDYGHAPLESLVNEQWPPSQVVMSHILNALLSSTRISHDIAMRTLGCLIDENYHDLAVLHQSTWEQRTEVLTKGGYVRYREKTATFLGDLAILVENKYNDDAANILPRDEAGEGARTTLSARLKEIKGLGPMGTEIFLGSIQHFFENVAPFLDSRSKKTAIAIRFGEDVDTIFAALQKNTASMAKLEVALTRIRLEKREGEFTRDIVNS